MKISVEKQYDILDDEEGVRLIVRPDNDTGGWVQLSADDVPSREFFGIIRLVIPPEMAVKLGQALIDCANDLLHEEDQ